MKLNGTFSNLSVTILHYYHYYIITIITLFSMLLITSHFLYTTLYPQETVHFGGER